MTREMCLEYVSQTIYLSESLSPGLKINTHV